MTTRAKVLMNDEEWESYRNSFSVSHCDHSPKCPPSYPVLVVSSPVRYRQTATGDTWISHSFIEVTDLKRMLGLGQ